MCTQTHLHWHMHFSFELFGVAHIPLMVVIRFTGLAAMGTLSVACRNDWWDPRYASDFDSLSIASPVGICSPTTQIQSLRIWSTYNVPPVLPALSTVTVCSCRSFFILQCIEQLVSCNKPYQIWTMRQNLHQWKFSSGLAEWFKWDTSTMQWVVIKVTI